MATFYDTARRRNMWYKRLLAEHKYCTGSAFFITLTYDDAHVPLKFDGDELVSFDFDKRDIQLFLKRFRRRYVEQLGRLRYFLVSEFGDKTGRPHYHALFFTDTPCSIAFMHEAIMKTWQNGIILDVQYLKGPGGIRYLTNYISKSFMDDFTFVVMSRRPGIGTSYVERNRDFHRQGIECKDYCEGDISVVSVERLADRKYFILTATNLPSGGIAKRSLPRFFSEKIYTRKERKLLFNRYMDEHFEFLAKLSPIDREIYCQSQRIRIESREEILRRKDMQFVTKHLKR